jgi:hypothetical protein
MRDFKIFKVSQQLKLKNARQPIDKEEEQREEGLQNKEASVDSEQVVTQMISSTLDLVHRI